MRVKLSIPSVKSLCWFVVYEIMTIYQLQKEIIKQLKLEIKPNQVALYLDDYVLLPHHIAKDVLREDDFLCLKTVSLQEQIPEKRKHDEKEKTHTSKRRKKDAETKREGGLREERRKIKEQQKKKRKIEKEKNKLLKSKKPKTKVVDKREEEEKKKEEKGHLDVNGAQNKIKKSSPPFQGLKRTKKRNQRRRMLKRFYRESIAAAANVNDASYTNEGHQTQPNACNTSTIEPIDSQVLPNSYTEEPPQLEDENIVAESSIYQQDITYTGNNHEDA